jgi:hypothetical protein
MPTTGYFTAVGKGRTGRYVCALSHAWHAPFHHEQEVTLPTTTLELAASYGIHLSENANNIASFVHGHPRLIWDWPLAASPEPAANPRQPVAAIDDDSTQVATGE